jgi:hypothetical protein
MEETNVIELLDAGAFTHILKEVLHKPALKFEEPHPSEKSFLSARKILTSMITLAKVARLQRCVS